MNRHRRSRKSLLLRTKKTTVDLLFLTAETTEAKIKIHLKKYRTEAICLCPVFKIHIRIDAMPFCSLQDPEQGRPDRQSFRSNNRHRSEF